MFNWLKTILMSSLVLLLVGCFYYRPIETARGKCCDEGYYNGYVNANATILYKAPSSKYRCYLAREGWYCVQK